MRTARACRTLSARDEPAPAEGGGQRSYDTVDDLESAMDVLGDRLTMDEAAAADKFGGSRPGPRSN